MRTAVAVALNVALGFSSAAAQAPDTTPTAVVRRQIETFNQRDLDGFMALYADDAVVFEFPSGKELWRGKAAIRAQYETVFKQPLPPVRVEPRIVDGHFVIENEVWDAKPGERNRAIWMYDIQAGLIRRVWRVRM
ncbi:MAG: SgcJ/EcaC family oxidoreductase [Gemmatimonadetes bacterium]|nr:SgcJ/EcaC family oxidoreductase [Gemmatimonadota bacterium]